MKDLKAIRKAIASYVDFVEKTGFEGMERFYGIGVSLNEAFPETSARDIADILSMPGFEKSNVALAMRVAREFPSVPKMSVHEYNRHQSFLGKIDIDKRVNTAALLHGANKDKIKDIHAHFGFVKASGKGNNEEKVDPKSVKLDERHLADILQKIDDSGMTELALYLMMKKHLAKAKTILADVVAAEAEAQKALAEKRAKRNARKAA